MKPEIRFKGFEGVWNLKHLTDEAVLYSGLTYTPADIRNNGTLVLRSSNVQDGEVALNDNVYVDPRVANSCNVEKGDIIVVVRNGSRTLIGKNAQIKRPMPNTVIGAFMTGLRTRIPEFINALLCTKAFDKFITENIGATINQITNATFKEMMFNFPEDSEQKYLGHYFATINKLIFQTNKHLTSLRQVKEASLQAMFPQKGEKVPRIRFKGFEGEWKKIQLCDCLTISNEKNLDNSFGIDDVLSVSDEVGVVNQIELLGRSYAGKSVANYGVLKTNQIVYTKSPLKSKPYGIIKVNKGKTGIVSVLYAIYDTVEGISPDYIHYYFDPSYRINNYLLPLVNKGAKNTMNISDEMALQGYITIPTLEEQSSIASYFRSLDRQISLQSQRLEKLKQIKAACLDKMFV